MNGADKIGPYRQAVMSAFNLSTPVRDALLILASVITDTNVVVVVVVVVVVAIIACIPVLP